MDFWTKTKKIIILTAAICLLVPSSSYSAFHEPTGIPPGGNVAEPIYSQGSMQNLEGGLNITSGGLDINSGGLNSTGSSFAVQGSLSSDSSGGDNAFYANVFSADANDYASVFYGGLGVQMASGDIYFLNRDSGISWPRVSDGAALYGLSVTTAGEIRIVGHGAGINFLNQNGESKLKITEAGNVYIIDGDLCFGPEGSVKCRDSWGDVSGWTDDGAVVRLTTSTDNVGIGTTAPKAKLDIRDASVLRLGIGNATFTNVPALQTDTSDTLALYTINNGANVTDWRFYIEDDANDSLSFWGNSCSGGGCNNLSKSSVIMKLQANGSIGIGTMSISSDLKVDAEGKIGATQFCDENGSYCFDPGDNERWYRYTVDVAGTCNKYYQVVMHGGDQNINRKIRIKRSYSTDPDAYLCYDNDSTPGSHVNALIVDFDVNFGGWGGQNYKWEIQRYGHEYHYGLADAGFTNHNIAFYVMLLGGYNNGEQKMRYYIETNVPFSYAPTVYYSSSELSYDHENPAYDVHALDPISSINWNNLYAHWDLTGRGIYSNGSNIGIGVASPSKKLDVAGTLGVSGDIYMVNNKSIRIDSNNHTNLIFGNYNGDNGAFTYGGTYNLNLSVEGDVKANRFCIGDSNCKSTWSEIGGSSGWTDDGIVVRLTTAGDNVGIGTPAPGAKLDVNGTGLFRRALTLIGQTDNADGVDRSTYWAYDDNVGLVMKTAANDGSTAILFPSTGNKPSDFAYIVYDEDYGEAGVAAGENGVLLLGSENDGTGSSDHVRVKSRLVVEADMSSSDPTAAFQVKSGNIVTDLFTVLRSGNVGIGTTAPVSSLHLYKSEGSNAEISLQSISGANKHWALYNERATDELRIWNNTDSNDAMKNIVRIKKFNSGTNPVNVSMAIGGNYDPDSNQNLTTPKLYANTGEFTNLCLGGGSGQDCITDWEGIVSAGGYWILNGTNLYPKETTYNVGIGTPAPGAKLDVNGSVIIRGASLTASQTSNAHWYLNSYEGVQIRLDSNSDDANSTFQINDGANSTVFWVDESGNINIKGNAEIQGDLTIGGDISAGGGADLAENFSSKNQLDPGTVVVMGDYGYRSIKPSSKVYDKTVVGVVSENPAIIMSEVDFGYKTPIALAGVVKVKVASSVHKGDLLTSSDIEGYAMKAEEYKPGAIIGKALEDFEGDFGEIMCIIILK